MLPQSCSRPTDIRINEQTSPEKTRACLWGCIFPKQSNVVQLTPTNQRIYMVIKKQQSLFNLLFWNHLNMFAAQPEHTTKRRLRCKIHKNKKQSQYLFWAAAFKKYMGSYIYPYRLCAADSLAHICWKASVRFCATSSQAQGQWVSRGPAVCIRDGLCWIPADALSSVSAAMQGKPLQSTLMLCFFLSYQSTSSANKQVYEWSCFCLTDENWKWSLSEFWRWGSSQTTTERSILGMLNQQVQGGQ